MSKRDCRAGFERPSTIWSLMARSWRMRLDGLATSMMNTTFNAAMRPVTDQVGGLLASGVGGLMQGLLPFADGAPFSQGRVMPFASGGIVSSDSLRDAWRHGRHG